MSGQCTHKHPSALSNLIDPFSSHMVVSPHLHARVITIPTHSRWLKCLAKETSPSAYHTHMIAERRVATRHGVVHESTSRNVSTNKSSTTRAWKLRELMSRRCSRGTDVFTATHNHNTQHTTHNTQQKYNLGRLRFNRRGASTPLWGVEACSPPSRQPNPIPAIPPFVVRTPHLHGAPTAEETYKL